MVMNIGRLRHRIEVYMPTVVQADGIGGSETTIGDPVSRWANVVVEQGIRGEQGMTAQNDNKYTITVRADNVINNNSIISWNGREMVIHSIERDYMNEYLTIVAWG